MHREHHKWYSPSLNREMDLLVFGHAGARALIFPTSKGKFYEWEDRGMMSGVFGPAIRNGWLQCYCVDSVDAESWYNWGAHPGYRAWRQTQYDTYLYTEVLPLMNAKNSNPFLMTIGASFGAYHAMNFGLKHADKVDRIIGMSGIYDIRYWASGYDGEHVYFNNPVQYINNEWEWHRLAALRHVDIIIVSGREDRLIGQARALSSVLWSKGIGNALREWDGWAHDWPYWSHMLSIYLNGHD